MSSGQDDVSLFALGETYPLALLRDARTESDRPGGREAAE